MILKFVGTLLIAAVFICGSAEAFRKGKGRFSQSRNGPNRFSSESHESRPGKGPGSREAIGKGKGPNRDEIGIDHFVKAKGRRWGKPPSGILDNPTYFEGDIDTLGLTNDEFVLDIERRHGKGKGRGKGRGNPHGRSKEHFRGKPRNRRQTSDDSWKWTDGIVPYHLDSSITGNEELVTAIAAAVQEIMDNTCITFRGRQSTDRDWVTFQGGAGGCSSYVGRIEGGQKISLGKGCEYKGIVIHEIMHALGFYHEQSRTDRDNYVQILWDNILPGYSENFQTYSVDYLDDLGVTYDYGSLLHYKASAFASRFGLKTIQAKQSTSLEMGQRDKLSEKDIQKINTLYQCQVVTKPSCFNRQPDWWCEHYTQYCPIYRDFMGYYCASKCAAC